MGIWGRVPGHAPVSRGGAASGKVSLQVVVRISLGRGKVKGTPSVMNGRGQGFNTDRFPTHTAH